MKISNIVKNIIKEDKTAIESNYVDFKRWAIEYGTTELFREKQWELPGEQEFTRSLEQTVEMEQPGQMFDILSRIWEMWNDESIEDKQEFGKALYNTMKEDDFFFDKEANGAKVGMDRQDADYLKQTYGVEMNEKKIGFNRGPEYSEETEDLLSDFAKSTEMINKELSKKVVSNDDPKVQEILNILDDNVNPEFIEDLETVYNLIQKLPDKPTDKPKVGFKSNLQETLQIRAGIIK